MITDKEIIEAAEIHGQIQSDNVIIQIRSENSFEAGAKWLREKQSSDLREELIAFYFSHNSYSRETSEHIVDLYLKNRK